MPSPEDSMREILEDRHYAVLATLNEDASIHLTPAWYLFDNGRFYVEVSSRSRKARNVVCRPNATIVVDIRQPGSESWVYASGHVEALRDDESRQINSRIKHRYLTEEAINDPRIGPAFEAADDMTICLIPESWRSWSSKDVDDKYFGGLLSSTPEKWFHPIDD